MMAGADPKAVASKYSGFIRAMQLTTGLSFRTLFTWCALENGPTDNPLNIGPGNHYGSSGRAAVATLALLKSDINNAKGYQSILATAGQGDDKQLKAIAFSAWNGGTGASFAVHAEYGKRLVSTYLTYFPKPPSSSFGAWVGQTVTDPGQSISDAGSWYKGAIGGILSQSLWIRILMVIVGAILFIGALFIFARELSK